MKACCVFLVKSASRRQWCDLFVAVVMVLCCAWQIQEAGAQTMARELFGEAVRDAQQSAAPNISKPGDSLTQSIKGGETQTFSIPLAAGQYAEVAIEQHGSILLATLFDPQRQEIVQMDTPSGGYGPIHFSIIASLSGDYRLEILSINKWANSASYDVALKVLRGAEKADQSLINAQLSFAQGRKSFRADNRTEAIKFYTEAFDFWKTSQDYHWQALTQFALAEAHRKSDDRKNCLEETLRLLAIEMAPNDWRLKASALNDLGGIHARGVENEKAPSVLNEALSLFTAHNDQRGQATVFGNLGVFYGRTGDLSRARELIDKAMLLRRAENDKPGEINLLNSLGALSDQLGEPDKALEYFEQALQGWEKLDDLRPADHAKIAVVLSNLATENDKLGRWDQALYYYDKALAKFAKDEPNRAVTLDSKGELYAALGDLASAKECYDEALKLLSSTETPDLDVRAGLFVRLGQFSLAVGDVAAAINNFEQARNPKPKPPRLADVLTNLGGALTLDGKSEKAREVYKEALEIQVKLGDKRGQALTLQKRGDACALMGQKSEALDDYNRALVFWKAVRDRRGEAATFNGIARVERDRGNFAAALLNNNEAIKIIESLRTNLSSRQLRISYFATQERLYEFDVDLKMQLSKADTRAKYLALAIESSERARARVLLDALSEANVGRETNGQSSDPRLAMLVSERDRLSQQFEAKAQARTKMLSGSHSDAQIAVLDRELQEINRKNDELEVKIRLANPRFAALTQPQPTTLPETQRELDAGTLLLEYSLGEQRSYVWAVTPDSINGFELPARREIEATAQRLTNAIADRNREVTHETPEQWRPRVNRADAEYKVASAALSKMVIDPIASLLGSKRLVIVADGALQLVSFGALPAPKPASALNAVTAQNRTPTGNLGVQRVLLENHEIVYEPSASVLALQRRELENRKRAPNDVAVLANPVFEKDDDRVLKAIARAGGRLATANVEAASSRNANEGNRNRKDITRALDDLGISRFRRLGSSETEAEAIKKVVPKAGFMAALNFEANRAKAMSKELANYRIVHFATHGVVNYQHPELSGIVLSMVDEKGQDQDGYLRLHDIYNLNLPADLVVLSACQTGVGKQIKGEGLIALTRGFMYAGAARVVASLWKVDDAATAELMAEFYKQMFANGLKPAAALQAAQLKLSQTKRWRSPYYWAGFVLQGEWK
jgi:CHAT domain-containing protein/tetratricopeptide (TPR) repeat protein